MASKQTTKMHPRTDSLLQSHLLKGTYYNEKGQYDDNIIQAAFILNNYRKDNNITKKLDDYSLMRERINSISRRIIQAESGEIYTEVWEIKEMQSELLDLRSRIYILRQELISFIIKSMEAEGIMEKKITKLQLQKIPLVFRGGVHAPTGADDESDEEDVDYEEDIIEY